MRTLLLLLGLALTVPARAAAPTGFDETTWKLGVSPATGMAWAPDGSRRLFVLEKGTGTTGRVHIIQMQPDMTPPRDGNDTIITSVFATEAVITPSECGLIGIAFDPAFVENHYLYVFVTVSASEQQILRYTDDHGTMTERTVLVTGLPTRGANHDGGGIGVGLDGKLYWSIGDNGAGVGVDQDLTLLAAKVSRAELDGEPVNDNPFNDGVGPNNEYIWARGFRNPFTFTFEPATGALWVNTVGTGYEQIFVPHQGDHAGYNDYENNQPAGYLTPALKYRTNGSDTRTLVSATRTSGVVTYTTSADHGFRVGERITIAGAGALSGAAYVTSRADRTFTMSQPGPDATVTGGTATTDNIGGSITGGAFIDGNLFPDDYQGNFIFGDYNSGNLTRVQLGDDHLPKQVDIWTSGVSSTVDLALGPDGALWGVGVVSGVLRRYAPSVVAPKMVVSGLHPWIVEGRTATFQVSLAAAPDSDVTVRIARSDGATTIDTMTSNLTFTTSSWRTPQAVVLHADDTPSYDSDRHATFELVAAGYPSKHVEARTIELEEQRLVVSVAQLQLSEGGSGSFFVSLSKAPLAPLTVSATSAGDADIVVDTPSLTFTALDWDQPHEVKLHAELDADSDADHALVTLMGSGVSARTVQVTANDIAFTAPQITSVPNLTAYVGYTYTYQVVASGNPPPHFTLGGAVANMSMNSDTGLLTWTPSEPMPANINIIADNGVAPSALQSASLVAVEDAGPIAVLTRPTNGELVSGTTAECFGDCIDDIGCTEGRFYIDDVLAWTDVVEGNHYHLGGAHNLWDTTTLTAGPHTVKLVVVDTSGHTAEDSATVCVRECFPVGEPNDFPEAETSEPSPEGAVESTTEVVESPESGDDVSDVHTTHKGKDDGCGAGATPLWLLVLVPLARRRARHA